MRQCLRSSSGSWDWCRACAEGPGQPSSGTLASALAVALIAAAIFTWLHFRAGRQAVMLNLEESSSR